MSKRVLIIDDSPTVRNQLTMALGMEGFLCVEAVDGQDAFEKVKADGNFDAAICDVNMPRMNGLEFVEEAMKVKADLPVVMLTTEAAPAMVKKAKELGAKGWMVKPFNPENLVKILKTLTKA